MGVKLASLTLLALRVLNKTVNIKYLNVIPFILENHDWMSINKLIKD